MLPLLIRRNIIKMIKHFSPHISGYTNAPQHSATMKPRVGGVTVASSSPFCSDRNRFQFKPSKNGRLLYGGGGRRGRHISSTVSSHKDEKDDSTHDDTDADDKEKYYSAKAIRRGFMDKTVEYDKKYLYHGRKRVYQGEDEDDVNDDKQEKKKIFPFTTKNGLNFEGVEAEIHEIEEIVVGNDMISADRIRRVEETVSKRVFSVLPILENVYDTGNFLAVCRSAEALGIGAVGVVAEKGLVFKQSGRTSGGAVKWQHISQYESTRECIEKVKKRGFRVLVTDFDNEKAKSVGEYDWAEVPTAVIFGNELDGVSETAKELADGKVYLPMSGFTESFNLSVSAALLLYHATEDRKKRIASSSSSSHEQQRGDMSEDEERLLRAIWLSRSVANYSRPKYMKGLIERFRLRKKKGEEGEERTTTTTIVHDDFNKKSNDEDNDEKEHEDIVAFQEILQPSQLLKRGKFLD